MRNLLLLLSFLMFSFASAQEKIKPNLSLKNQFIKEVYGELDQNSQLSKNLNILLTERIEYLNQKWQSEEKYPNLSEFDLFNKYNSSLIRDVEFNADTFNPIKYNLNFYSHYPKIYRIDNNWLLVIHPQN